MGDGENCDYNGSGSVKYFSGGIRCSSGANFFTSITFLYYFLITLLFFSALPISVKCDENDFFSFNSYSISPDAQSNFDYASRGQLKFGDPCNNTLQCGFERSICDSKNKKCRCADEFQATNHLDKCGKMAAYNESCFFNEQCEAFSYQTECRDGRCICKFDLVPVYTDDKFECGAPRPTKKTKLAKLLNLD